MFRFSPGCCCGSTPTPDLYCHAFEMYNNYQEGSLNYDGSWDKWNVPIFPTTNGTRDPQGIFGSGFQVNQTAPQFLPTWDSIGEAPYPGNSSLGTTWPPGQTKRIVQLVYYDPQNIFCPDRTNYDFMIGGNYTVGRPSGTALPLGVPVKYPEGMPDSASGWYRPYKQIGDTRPTLDLSFPFNDPAIDPIMAYVDIPADAVGKLTIIGMAGQALQANLPTTAAEIAQSVADSQAAGLVSYEWDWLQQIRDMPQPTTYDYGYEIYPPVEEIKLVTDSLANQPGWAGSDCVVLHAFSDISPGQEEDSLMLSSPSSSDVGQSSGLVTIFSMEFIPPA